MTINFSNCIGQFANNHQQTSVPGETKNIGYKSSYKYNNCRNIYNFLHGVELGCVLDILYNFRERDGMSLRFAPLCISLLEFRSFIV